MDQIEFFAEVSSRNVDQAFLDLAVLLGGGQHPLRAKNTYDLKDPPRSPTWVVDWLSKAYSGDDKAIEVRTTGYAYSLKWEGSDGMFVRTSGSHNFPSGLEVWGPSNDQRWSQVVELLIQHAGRSFTTARVGGRLIKHKSPWPRTPVVVQVIGPDVEQESTRLLRELV